MAFVAALLPEWRSVPPIPLVTEWVTWVQNYLHDHGTAQEILPHLYLGDIAVARNAGYLNELGIKAIVNVAKECPNFFPDKYAYYNLAFEDTGLPPIEPELKALFAFIDHHRQQGNNVLIHCVGGVSRSVTFTVAYVMATQRISFDQAWQHVKTRRPLAGPKTGFIQQLQALPNPADLPD